MTEGLSAAAGDRRWAKLSIRRPSPTGIRLTSGRCGYSINRVSVSSTSSREEKGIVGERVAAGSQDFFFQQATDNPGFLKGELDFREVLHGRPEE